MLSLTLGSVELDFAELWQGSSRTIFLYVRLPRTLVCLVCGAALAASGAVIQGVLANKLASPGIIGVNSGAGLAVTVCTVLGIYSGVQVTLGAFLGALFTVMLVTSGAAKLGASKSTVILAGVALNSLLNALSSAIITLCPEVGVLSNDFKVGDFSAVTYQKLNSAGILILVTLAVLFMLSNELEVLGMGEETAVGLGMDVRRMRT